MIASRKKLITHYLLAQIALATIALANDYIIQNTSQGGVQNFDSHIEKVIAVLLFAPFFETLVFNFGINELLSKVIKKDFLVIIISSLGFSLIHIYSFSYFVAAFFAGLVLNMFYFRVRKKDGMPMAAFLVFLLHFFHNALGLAVGK